MEANVNASNEIPGEDSGKPAFEEEAVDPGCLDPLHKEDAQDGGGTN